MNNKILKIRFFLKGADEKITGFLESKELVDEVMEKSTEYAKIGLRTLVFAKRTLSEELYKEFQIEHNKEDNSKALSIIEKDMEFIGIQFNILN